LNNNSRINLAYTEMNQTHTTNAVLMVRPVDFEFNAQTAVDNEFQKFKEGVTDIAVMEFDASVEILRREGIHVVVLDTADQVRPVKTPDAVFPNNWFGTTRDGKLIVYTMATENRRAETRRLNEVKQLLYQQGFDFDEVPIVLQEYLGGTEPEPEDVLEGTGAFVIDHLNSTVYAAKSCRCSPKALRKYMDIRQPVLKESVMFETKSSKGKEIYHANVMLSIGTKFAVVCADSIVENPECPECLPRDQVLKKLAETRTVITITHEQAEKFFCANILELRGDNNEPKIAMSASAYRGFTDEQREVLSQFGKLVPLPLDNAIEYVGGGSARCMLAEIFLPKKQEPISTEMPLDSVIWYFLLQHGSQPTQENSPIMESLYENVLDTVAV
jgi:hypothetical protein